MIATPAEKTASIAPANEIHSAAGSVPDPSGGGTAQIPSRPVGAPTPGPRRRSSEPLIDSAAPTRRGITSRHPAVNIVLIMADQLAASVLPCYGNPVARTPHLDTLAEAGCVFEHAYCNSPICAASRASMMTGRLPSEIGVYDNGAELPAAAPTFCHALRRHGYRTVLSGKMHFVGPDQLHGFEERLTTDIYPSGFDWTPDWNDGCVHNPGASVRDLDAAGLCAGSLQIDYDEEVAFQAVRCIYDHARQPERPLFLCASFTHPHDPFIITPEYWNLYRDGDIPPPRTRALALEAMHPYARWVGVHHELDLFPPTPEVVTRTRHAYYGMVSYLDAKVGQILRALRQAGLAERTAVLFTSDHGEMLGEHGMWYKRVFYEDAARVPLLLRWPERVRAGRVPQVCSLLDLAPTLCAIAGIGGSGRDPVAAQFHGASLLPLAAGQVRNWRDEACAEYLGEGVIQPCRMLRRGRYKAVFVRDEPGQLFDLEADPLEQHDLAGLPEVAAVEAELRAALVRGFDPDAVNSAVRQSQAIRRALASALASGRAHPWDFLPAPPEPGRYVRRETVPSAARRRHLPVPDRSADE